jgi:hypothetical protein
MTEKNISLRQKFFMPLDCSTKGAATDEKSHPQYFILEEEFIII